MPEFDYKCVPVPKTISTGTVGKGSHDAAVAAYENIIKDAARGGWELVLIDTITSHQSPGCFASLIGLFTGKKGGEEVMYKLLIFKKRLS